MNNNIIQQSYSFNFSSIVLEKLRQVDSEGVRSRMRNTLRHCDYDNKGPNYLIRIDEYDKLKRYGICIHGAIDGLVSLVQ